MGNKAEEQENRRCGHDRFRSHIGHISTRRDNGASSEGRRRAVRVQITCIIHKPGFLWGEGRNGLAPEVPTWSLRPSRPSPLKHSLIPSLQLKIYE
jgi:hypothetical protein